MAIQDLSLRPSLNPISTSINLPTTTLSAPADADASLLSTLPATSQDLSSGGLFMGLLQLYGNEHPSEAKAFLQGVATTLRAYAGQADRSLISLSSWADRFQQAAETGDLSTLVPRTTPSNNLGVRAYQAAQATLDDPTEVLKTVPPPAGDTATPNMLEALSRELVELSAVSIDTVNALAGRNVTSASALNGTLTSESASSGTDTSSTDTAANSGESTLDPNGI